MFHAKGHFFSGLLQLVGADSAIRISEHPLIVLEVIRSKLFPRDNY
jgi:hypothetical protein